MSISNSSITTSNVDVLTVGAGLSYANVALVFCNFGAAAETLDVWAVPSGGSVTNATKIISALVLAAGETYVFESKLLLGAADKITVKGTVGGLVTTTCSYMSI